MRYLLASILAWLLGWAAFLLAERLAHQPWHGLLDYAETFRIFSLGFAALLLVLGAPGFFALRRTLSSKGFRWGALLFGLTLGIAGMMVASLLTTGEIDWASFLHPRPDLLHLEVLFVTTGIALGALVLWLNAFAPRAHPRL